MGTLEKNLYSKGVYEIPLKATTENKLRFFF